MKRTKILAAILLGCLFVGVIALALRVSMTGSGSHGAIMPGWSIVEECTPAVPGDTRGSVGSASYTAKATETSRFVMDNDVVMTHDAAGSFRGRASEVSVDAARVSVSVAGPMQFLNVDKVMSPVWFQDDNDFLAYTYGSGTGQVASVYGIAVDPVDGGVLVGSYGTVDGVDRYKVIKYSASGVYVTEFGASGSGNGQFGASGIAVAVSPVDQAVWVTDAGNNRIQKFVTADGGLTYSYSTKVGSSGSGNGQFGSGVPMPVAVDSAGNVYVGDKGNNRVQKFNSSAVYQAQVSVAYSALSGAAPYGIAVDSSDTIYVSADLSPSVDKWPGTIHAYNTSLVLQNTLTIAAPSGTTTGIGNIAIDSDDNIWAQWFSATYLVKYDPSGNLLATWQSLYPQPTNLNTNIAVAAGDNGQYALFRPSAPFLGANTPYGSKYVTGFNFAAVLLEDATRTYMEACDSSLNGWTLDWQATTNPEVVFPGWSGNVWAKLKELFATHGVELGYDAGTQTFIVYDVGSRELTLENMEPVSTKPENLTGGRVVDVIYQQPRAGGGVVWDAATENESVSVQVGQRLTRTLYTNNHPAELAQPVPTDTLPIQPGQYYVIDNTGTAVPAATWLAAGGNITVTVGDSPGTISATFQGPASNPTGFTGPYSFATASAPNGIPALSLVGNGTFCNPQTFIRAESQGQPYDSPFMDTVDRVLSRGHKPSLKDPNVTLTTTVPTKDLPGIGRTAGCIVPYQQSRYRITRVTWGNLKSRLEMERYVTAADWETTWAGETAADYETYWPAQGYSAGDEQVQPLRHS